MVSPSPTHILRDHRAQINELSFSTDNARLYSGDASGQVVVTSTRSLRPLAAWKAHSDGILGVQEWNEDSIITHGRDHKLHVWTRVLEPKSVTETAGALATTPILPVPSLKLSMDVNALNYCRFSLLPGCKSSFKNPGTMVALPNLIDSSLADIWAIPTVARLHAAIGQDVGTSGPGDAGRGASKTGIIMSLHLFRGTHASASSQTQLRLVLAYEDGSVSLSVCGDAAERSIEGRGWDKLWTVKSHVESVMGMAVSRDNTVAFTISADHLLCRYELEAEIAPGVTRLVAHRTKHPGNGAIAIRDDGRVLAVGGWDGKVRLYSTKTFKTLGTLAYHKDGCYAVAFTCCLGTSMLPDDETAESIDEIEAISRWLVTGGKDNRIAVWQLMDFQK